MDQLAIAVHARRPRATAIISISRWAFAICPASAEIARPAVMVVQVQCSPGLIVQLKTLVMGDVLGLLDLYAFFKSTAATSPYVVLRSNLRSSWQWAMDRTHRSAHRGNSLSMSMGIGWNGGCWTLAQRLQGATLNADGVGPTSTGTPIEPRKSDIRLGRRCVGPIASWRLADYKLRIQYGQ